MKKVLIAFDGEHFAKGALDFACTLNDAEPILLTGLFLPSVDYTDIMIYYAGGMAGPVYIPAADTDPEAIPKNIERFKAFCVKNHIEHRVHNLINGPVVKIIKKESRYADMILLSGETFYSNLGELTQREYLEDTLHKSECPVIVFPENYKAPKSVILSYDGTETSVYAIKQFAYLLPQLCNLPTLVVFASPDGQPLPELEYMEELGARHFKDLTFFKLDADAKKYYNTWLMDRGAAMVVSGSYAKGGISQLFRKHFVEDIISDHKLPVFIAHK